MLTLENYVVVEGERRSAVCVRHADLMSVPKGWSIDDRRENPPRLFRAPKPSASPTLAKPKKSATELKAKKKPAVLPYARENGMAVAIIGSIFGGRNGIRRINKHRANPNTNLNQFFTYVFIRHFLPLASDIRPGVY